MSAPASVSERPKPHDFTRDPETPGVCLCRLPLRNAVHSTEAIAAYERERGEQTRQVAAGQAWHRRRTGET